MAEIIDNRFPRIVTTDSQNNMDLSGGNGDFTTCKMTVINQTGVQAIIIVPCIIENFENPEEKIASSTAILGNDSTEVSVILYKGKAYCDMDNFGYTYTFSGDYDDDEGICYGDCTITLLSGGES